MKNILLILFVAIASSVFFSSCAPRLDYGHRTNYWNKRHPYDHRREKYSYPKRNPDNRAKYNSYHY